MEQEEDMAARLTKRAGNLYLGVWMLGETRWTTKFAHQWRVGAKDWSEPYQSDVDAEQGCESEVRRLLKEAGCEVE